MHPSMNVRHQAPQGQHPIARNAPLQNKVLRYGTPNKKLVDAVKYANENDFVSLMNAALADGCGSPSPNWRSSSSSCSSA